MNIWKGMSDSYKTTQQYNIDKNIDIEQKRTTFLLMSLATSHWSGFDTNDRY